MHILYKLMNDFLNRELDPAFSRRARIILDELNLQPGMKVLDIGCGRGFYEAAIMILEPKVQMVALDASSAYLTKAKETIDALGVKHQATFVHGDAAKLPFSDNSFDRIICSEVLEHIPNDHTALSEMRRILKKGGFAMVSVPHQNYPFLWDPLNWVLERLFKWHIPANIWWLAGIWADHVRLYTEGELTVKIRESGLGIGHIWRTTHYCLPFSHFLLYGIGKNLVEKGIVSGGFNRFNMVKTPSTLHKMIHGLFNLFDQYNTDNDTPSSSFLNIVAKLEKSR